MLTIYGTPKSRSLRITWLAEELGLEYDYYALNFAEGEHRGDAFLAINSGGKVPAITEGEHTLTESGAIINYLADKHAPGKLIPPVASIERAEFDRWSFFAISELEQPLWTMGKHKFALPRDQRIKEIFPTAEWEYQKALALLSEGLGSNDYILGEQFSAVDILLLQTLKWGQAFGQDLPQANLKAYYERGTSRPAYEKAVAREAGE